MEPEELGERIVVFHAAGQAAWPELDVTPAQFAAFLSERINDAHVGVAALPLADLYLACACAAGVPGAIAAFDRHAGAAIATFVRMIDPAPGFVDEVAQIVKHRLFVGRSGSPPRIGSYRGQGPLAAWVGVVAQRAALQLRRGESAIVRTHRRAFEGDPSPAIDPELAHLKQRYKGVFEEAFRDAFSALSDQQRALMRLRVRGGLTLARIGAMYRVDTATVWRWLDAAHRGLLAETQRLLHQRLKVSPEEFTSLARLVGSQIDVSVVRLLGGESVVPAPERREPR